MLARCAALLMRLTVDVLLEHGTFQFVEEEHLFLCYFVGVGGFPGVCPQGKGLHTACLLRCASLSHWNGWYKRRGACRSIAGTNATIFWGQYVSLT